MIINTFIHLSLYIHVYAFIMYKIIINITIIITPYRFVIVCTTMSALFKVIPN